MAPSKSALFSSLLLGCSTLAAAANVTATNSTFTPFEVDLLYPKNNTYAAGFQGAYFLSWNTTGLKAILTSSILDLGQNPPKVVGPVLVGDINTGGQTIVAFAPNALAPGQYMVQYTLSIPQTCNNMDGTNFFNKTDGVVFTMSTDPGALHPNGSDFFVGNNPCRAISIPFKSNGQTGDCSTVDMSNAGPVVHNTCPDQFTMSEFEDIISKAAGFNPNIPLASQTATAGTMTSSSSSGLGMVATPFPGVVAAAGAGLVGLGAALL